MGRLYDTSYWYSMLLLNAEGWTNTAYDIISTLEIDFAKFNSSHYYRQFFVVFIMGRCTMMICLPPCILKL